ncbi:MAG: uroporphyrinogen-III synthase [Betaproteobacteria bacterium]|nr:uroporphyrinogen-III synthase [Betaproteobacteria bacterium]
MMNEAHASLAGLHVLVTRPEHQADELARLIRLHGGEPVRLPTIVIAPVADPSALVDVSSRLDSFDFAIFASANAVRHAMPTLAQHGWPGRVIVLAVGEGTVRELARQGIADAMRPADGSDSEAVLRMPALGNVSGRRVLIVSGADGRDLLRGELERRGAKVEQIAAYRRVAPRETPADALELIAKHHIDVVTCTSGEGVRNLYRMLDPALAASLRTVPHVVSHERIAAAVRGCGVDSVILSGSGDAAIVEALLHHVADGAPRHLSH